MSRVKVGWDGGFFFDLVANSVSQKLASFNRPFVAYSRSLKRAYC